MYTVTIDVASREGGYMPRLLENINTLLLVSREVEWYMPIMTQDRFLLINPLDKNRWDDYWDALDPIEEKGLIFESPEDRLRFLLGEEVPHRACTIKGI